jgi:membrane protein required for colicin V production
VAIDLIILGCILLFGLLGALAGGAAQIAQVAGMVLAFLCARPLGKWLGPKFAASFQMPMAFGVIVTTLLVFLIVLVASRIVIAFALRRMMAGKDPHDRSLDRTVGLVVAALKVSAIAYVIVSALAFVEDNVVVAGRKLGVSPRDSYAFKLARSYNLFEKSQFAPVQDLVRIARSARAGDTAELEKNAAYRALKDDPRFKKALEDPAMRRAVESGDYRVLLQNNYVLQLIQDPTIAARLAAAAKSAD